MEPNQPPITRRTCARSHLEAAIYLFFENLDQISAHTLAWAAADLLKGVGRHRGVPVFDDQIDILIKPEFQKKWRGMVKRHYNFSKHADRDPVAEISNFNPLSTSYILHTAISDYQTIYGQVSLIMRVFWVWFGLRHPDLCTDEEFYERLRTYETLFGPVANLSFGESLGPAHDLVVELRRDPTLTRIVASQFPQDLTLEI